MSPPSLHLCAWLPAFRLQAACGGLPAAAAMATERQGPLELVAAANLAAIQSGIHCGMAVAQALGRCPAVQPWPVRADAEAALSQRLLALADRISPRVQPIAPDLAVLDFAGLQRLHGSAQAAAAKMEQAFAPAGLTLRTGIAAQPAMALLAAKSGQRRLPAGQEAEALAPLPLALLAECQELTRAVAAPDAIAETLALLERWGIRTLGALAALPAAPLAARLGAVGVHLRALARAEVAGILNPPPPPETRLIADRQFDPPLHDLQVLKTALEQELARFALVLERQDRVVEAAELELALERGAPPAPYSRAFAVPLRDARALAAQLQLEIERHPPRAALLGFHLELRLARPRRFQARMFSAAAPDREKLPKLLGLLSEVFDRPAERRVGSPRLLDSHRPQAFTMEPFAPPPAEDEAAPPTRASARGGSNTEAGSRACAAAAVRGGRAVGTAGQVGAERPRNSVGRSAPGDRSGAGPAGLGSQGPSPAERKAGRGAKPRGVPRQPTDRQR